MKENLMIGRVEHQPAREPYPESWTLYSVDEEATPLIASIQDKEIADLLEKVPPRVFITVRLSRREARNSWGSYRFTVIHVEGPAK